MKLARKLGGDDAVTNLEMADAFSRQHRMVAKYAGQGGAPVWANGMINLMNQRFDEVNARIGELDVSIRNMNAKINAGYSRSFNSSNRGQDHIVLRQIVKYEPGHPGPMPPPLHQFHFDEQQYEVGVLPPVGLVPDTFAGVMGITGNARIDLIYWFYNDPRLAAHEGQGLNERRLALKEFLMFS